MPSISSSTSRRYARRPGSRRGQERLPLGELFHELRPQGVGVVDGFATTARHMRLLDKAGLRARLQTIFSVLDVEDLTALAAAGQAARSAVLETPLPEDLQTALGRR